MPKAKPLTKEDLLRAMRYTRSNRAASRYLAVSYHHYRMYAKLYKSDKEGFSNLFEEHLNKGGKGIPKHLPNSGRDPALLDIIEGRIDHSSFTPERLKFRLVSEGFLEEKCYNCGFCDRRMSDYKMPLLLHFKDKNKRNWHLKNLEFLCYNCYYLYIGNIFSNKQIEGIEDHKPVNLSQVDWEIDQYTLDRFKELGLEPDKNDKDDDDFDIISYLK
jgi:hypothetical protein